MSKNPKISVIVPAYNVGKYIKKSLFSIINQSFKDYELIIINDGSTDNTLDEINIALNNSKLNWKLINQQNHGVSFARNVGIDQSVGDKIVFIDPDDIISFYFLEELYNNSIIYNSDVSICGYKFIKNLDEDLDELNSRVTLFSHQEIIKHFLLRDISFLVVTMLIDRNIIVNNKISFDEKIHFSEDQLFMWDVLLNCKKIAYLSEELYGYYLRENSTMTSSNKEKILNSYPFVANRLNKLKNKEEILKYALPRWKLGALYTASKLMNYDDFISTVEIMKGKKIYKELKGFEDIKAKMLSFVLKVSSKLFYDVSRRLN